MLIAKQAAVQQAADAAAEAQKKLGVPSSSSPSLGALPSEAVDERAQLRHKCVDVFRERIDFTVENSLPDGRAVRDAAHVFFHLTCL
jgi:hypothetical protein